MRHVMEYDALSGLSATDFLELRVDDGVCWVKHRGNGAKSNNAFELFSDQVYSFWTCLEKRSFHVHPKMDVL